MLLWTLNRQGWTSPLVIEAAGQGYRQTRCSFYTRAVLSPKALTFCSKNDESDSYGRARKIGFKTAAVRYGGYAPFTLKVRVLKTEVTKILLYGRVTWTLGQDHFA